MTKLAVQTTTTHAVNNPDPGSEALIVLTSANKVNRKQLLDRARAILAGTFPETGEPKIVRVGRRQDIADALRSAGSPGCSVAIGTNGFGFTVPSSSADAYSLEILAKAILSDSAPAALRRLADVAAWRDGFALDDSPDARQARAWWEKQLTSPVRWPFSPDPDDCAHGSAVIERKLAAETSAALFSLAETRGWQRATPLLGAWWLLLQAIAERPATLWAEVSGRQFAQLSECVGKLERLVPLSASLEPGEYLSELLASLDASAIAGQAIQDFAPVADKPDIGFAWRERAFAGSCEAAWQQTALECPGAFARLTLTVCAAADQVSLRVHGQGTMIAPDDLGYLTDQFLALLDAMAKSPDRSWESLLPASPEPVGSVQEPEQTILHAIEGWVRSAPDQVAVVDAFDSLTYQQLWARSGLVAARLRALGAGPQGAIGLLGDKSVATAVAVFGAWRAGTAYLPLDPAHPDERLRAVLAQAEAVAIVADPQSAARAAGFGLPTLLVTEDGRDGDADLPTVTPLMAAYCIATSGSTGVPKLVEVSHGNLAAYCSGVIEATGIGHGHRFAMVTGWATDLGLTMVTAALTTGGTLHLVPSGTLVQASAFAGFVRAHAIEILKLTPTHLKALLAQPGGDAVLPSRLLMLGGEAIPWGLVDTVAELAPQLSIWNHYGPTETTIGAITGRIVSHDRTRSESPPLGRAFPNLNVVIRDGAGRVCADWVPGQICIAGGTVARGYRGAPAATATAFLPVCGGGREYATGDRGRRLRDGRIVFLGRRDFQVKVAGYRIDPGEVEAALRSIAGVSGAVVVPRSSQAGEVRLVAYVVPGPDAAFDPASWRKALARSLPPAALPTAFVQVSVIPLRDNGKPAIELLPAETAEGVAGKTATASQEMSDKIAAIWTELLGIAEVEPDDRFFDLGGHSLQMLTMHQLLTERLGVELTLIELFANPTVAGIAALAEGKVGDDVAATARSRANRQRSALADLKARRKEVANHDD